MVGPSYYKLLTVTALGHFAIAQHQTLFFFSTLWLLSHMITCYSHTFSFSDETDSMLMLNKDNECRNRLGFQLNTYGMSMHL
jgi:hypothetical protein